MSKFKCLAWGMALLALPSAGAWTQGADRTTRPDEAPSNVVRILRTNNKAQTNRYVVKVYEFKNVNPYAVLRFLQRPVAAEQGAIFTFVAPDGKSGRVLIGIPEYQLESFDRLVAYIDREGQTSSDDARRIYRQLKHRRTNISADPALDDSAFINQFAVYLTGNESKIIVDPEQNAIYIEDAPSGADYLDEAITEKLDRPTPQAVMNVRLWELATSNNTRIGLDYVAWRNGIGAPLFSLGAFNERGRVSLREGNSGFLNNASGIPLGSSDSVIPGDGSNSARTRSLRGDFNAQGYNFAWRYEFNSAYFDYLASRGKARVLTRAKLAALNTRTAHLSAVDQILFYRVNTDSPLPSGVRTDSGGSLVQSEIPFAANRGRGITGSTQVEQSVSQFNDVTITGSVPPFAGNIDITISTPNGSSNELVSVETGLEIDLTPLIYENGLDVTVAVSISDFNGYADNGEPLINSRSFDTVVRLGEGEEIVLGGLTRSSAVRNSPKAPILGSLPIIGSIFGSENTRREESEVVLALHIADIVRYGDDAGSGINDEDAAVIRQAEGTDPIEPPLTTWGFDMFGRDVDKHPYAFLGAEDN